MEEENKKGWEKLINSAWFYIIVSIAIILYIIFIVTPYANETNMFSEGTSPNEDELAIYRLMIWPISIMYLIYVKKIDKFNKYIKILIYPLTTITILFLLWYFLPTLGGGSAMWLLFLIIPLSPFLLIGAIIYEIINHKRKKEQ